MLVNNKKSENIYFTFTSILIHFSALSFSLVLNLLVIIWCYLCLGFLYLIVYLF